MKVTGLTGGSGSGKSTAARLFASLGFYWIDTDRIVHEQVYTDPSFLRAVADAFGAECAADRKKLSRLVFSDAAAYARLMELIMPPVERRVLEEMERHAEEMLLLDAPLLFEYGMDRLCRYTVAVVCDDPVSRIVTRDGVTVAEAERRIANQKSAAFYRQHCNFVIENNGSLDDLKQNVSNIASLILKG